MRALPALLPFLLFIFAVAERTARAQTVVLTEDFDAAVPPAAPSGWALDSGWTTSSGSASSGSGLNNLTHSGSHATAATLPAIDLTEATFATLAYLGRRTGSYDPSNLRVTASVDGGATFATTVLGAGAAMPAAASTYELITAAIPSTLFGASEVVLRFEGFGLSSSGSNARIDDLVVEMYTSAESAAGTVGFSASASEALGNTDSVLVPIQLDFTAPPGLQGLQFRVSWTADSLALAGLHTTLGPDWTTSYEAGAQSADILALGSGVTSLPSGTYDSLFTLQFTVGHVDAEMVDVLTLSNVVGALATPEGSDAGLLAGASVHTLTVVPGEAVFAASPAVLDVGTVTVGASDSVVVTVSNPAGTTNLEVTDVISTSSLYSISPSSGVIAPDESMYFVVTFAPVDTAFGLQEAEIVFHHTGADSLTTLTITGKGRGGRGDAEGDGTVDVLDVVHTIDFVLARISPEPAQATAADLFPFPDGDGGLDVRDLTVMSQAVARGQWPDGLPLPAEAAPAAKSAAGAAHVALLKSGEGGYMLELRHDVPMRAFQLILPAETEAVAAAALPNMIVRSGYDESRSELRIVAYVADGGAVEAGTQRLAITGPVQPPRYATLVGSDRSRIALEAEFPTWVEPPEVPPTIGAPYPNPFLASAGPLRILSLPVGSEVDVFDVLGRRVLTETVRGGTFEWHGRDAVGRDVAPGLYITRLRAEGLERSWAVAVIR